MILDLAPYIANYTSFVRMPSYYDMGTLPNHGKYVKKYNKSVHEFKTHIIACRDERGQ